MSGRKNQKPSGAAARSSPSQPGSRRGPNTPNVKGNTDQLDNFVDWWIRGIEFNPPLDSAAPDPPRVVEEQVTQFRMHLVDALAKYSSVETLQDFVDLVRAPFVILLNNIWPSCTLTQVLDPHRCDQLCSCIEHTFTGQAARADDCSPLADSGLLDSAIDSAISFLMIPAPFFRRAKAIVSSLILPGQGSVAEPPQTADAPTQPVSVPLPKMLFQFLAFWLRYSPHREYLTKTCVSHHWSFHSLLFR